MLESRRKREALGLANRFHEGLAHAPAGAVDRDPDHGVVNP